MPKKTGYRFVRGAAASYLYARARELGMVATKPADLVELGILRTVKINAYKLLNGSMRVTWEHAQHIQDKLKIPPGKWAEITVALDSAPSESLVAYLPEYFARLQRSGLANALAFVPQRVGSDDLVQYCVPVRVVTEEEWTFLSGERLGKDATPSEGMAELVARRASGVLLNGWLRRAHSRVVIKGEPGEGKTTALWLYVASLCRQWCDCLQVESAPGQSDARPVPLVLPLRDLDAMQLKKKGIVELAVEHVVHLVRPGTDISSGLTEWLLRKCHHSEFELLLDGLDECPADCLDALQAELEQLEHARVILTTRYHAEPARVMRKYALLRVVPLRCWVIDQFVDRYFAGRPDGTTLATGIRRSLRMTPALRQLAHNPLLLAAMCHLQDGDELAALPTTRAGLLHAVLRALLRRGDARRRAHEARPLRDEAKIDILAEVAWHFQHEQARPMPETELLSVLMRHLGLATEAPPVTAAGLLSEFVEDGVLIRRGQGPYGFILRRFQEYCLARRIARMTRSDGAAGERSGAFIRGRGQAWGRTDWANFRPLNQPAWAEIWPLVAGCSQGNNTVMDEFLRERDCAEDLVSSRLRLLTMTIGEFLEANPNAQAIAQQWKSVVVRISGALLDRAAEEPALTSLVGSWRACLAQLPATIMVPEVLARLSSPSVETAQANSYVLALGEIGTLEAREHLQLMLGDAGRSEELRAHCAIALGLVGDTAARECVLHWLTKSRGRLRIVHFGCISGLGLIADEPGRQALAALLEDHIDPDARWQCIRECEHLFGPEISDQLLKLLERFAHESSGRHAGGDDVREIMEQSAMVLGRIGGPETAERMLPLLKLALPPSVKQRICDAIAETGDIGGREGLRALTKGNPEDRRLSNYAGLALIRVRDEELLPSLLNVASGPKCPASLREAVVEACQWGSPTKVVPFLGERLFDDPDARVKLAAARGLTGHGGPVAMNALRRALDARLPKEVLFECARGLAMEGDDAGIAEMESKLEDRQAGARFRASALQALGALGTLQSRSLVRRVYEDEGEPSYFRARALDVLQTIQRTQGWRPLIAGGWEEP